MVICEVIETKYAFKPNQKDPKTGDVLPLGSILVRIGSHQNNLGMVRNVFARPAGFNQRVPLIGEQVLVSIGPTNDWSTSKDKGQGFMYFSPLNGTDDLVLHTFPRLWKRKGLAPSQNPSQIKSDKEEPGYTFPKNPKSLDRLQPFEGDDLIQGRFGQSIRLGSTVEGDMSVYSEKPTWKGGSNSDPILILNVRKQSGSGKNYTVEDIDKDKSSIYLTSTQKIANFKAGFNKNVDVKKISQEETAQIVVNSDRVVLNAKKDILFLIGKEQTIVTGKKVLFQSENYKVDLDELMDWLKSHADLDKDLASGVAQYSTAAGPTATATSVADFIKLATVDFQKFKMP